MHWNVAWLLSSSPFGRNPHKNQEEINMKNLLFVLLLVVFLPLFLQSQSVIEIQGGTNIANLSNPNNLIAGAVWKTRVGFIGGVSTVFNLSENVFINPGLRFVQKGTKSEWTSFMTGDVKATLTNNYLELPVYIKYEFANISSQLFAIGGPSFAYLLSSTMEGKTQFQGNSSTDSKNLYKTYDVTFDLGISLQSPINEKISLLASAMYSFGFVKVSKNSDEGTRDVKLLVGLSYLLQ